MNYTVKAYRIVSKNGNTTLEDYEKSVPNYFEAKKELIRLKSMGEYTNVSITKKEREL
jgi:hypothetical protein